MTDYQLSKITGLPQGTLWRWRNNLWHDKERWLDHPATFSLVTLMRYYRTNGDALRIQDAGDLAKNGIQTAASYDLKFDTR